MGPDIPTPITVQPALPCTCADTARVTWADVCTWHVGQVVRVHQLQGDLESHIAAASTIISISLASDSRHLLVWRSGLLPFRGCEGFHDAGFRVQPRVDWSLGHLSAACTSSLPRLPVDSV